MKFHIVRNGETVEDIVFMYGLEVNEIKKENKHIRSWDRIIPGTKLRIPTIPESVELDVASMEPFIEDYYPKLKLGEELKEQKVEDYNYQEIDNYVIKSTKNNNIQDTSELKTEVVEAPTETPVEEVKKPIEVKISPKPKVEDEEETEEDEPVLFQQVYYPYYPYYVYNRYTYPKLVYPVYVYPNRNY